MGSYIPSTPAERQAMLEAIGLKDYRDLYRDVPQSMILDRPLDVPSGMSELEAAGAEYIAENVVDLGLFLLEGKM